MHAKPTNKAKCFSHKVFKVHQKLTNVKAQVLALWNYWRSINTEKKLIKSSKLGMGLFDIRPQGLPDVHRFFRVAVFSYLILSLKTSL